MLIVNLIRLMDELYSSSIGHFRMSLFLCRILYHIFELDLHRSYHHSHCLCRHILTQAICFCKPWNGYGSRRDIPNPCGVRNNFTFLAFEYIGISVIAVLIIGYIVCWARGFFVTMVWVSISIFISVQVTNGTYTKSLNHAILVCDIDCAGPLAGEVPTEALVP